MLPGLVQAAGAKATRKQEKVLLPKSLFVPDDQVCGSVWWSVRWMCWPVYMCVVLTVPASVNLLYLQNLFHVTDVFLPPDYVANLQKVNDPTLTHTVTPAVYSCHLLPFPTPTSQCGTPQYPVPSAPLRGNLPPDLHALPPVQHPTALLGGRARGQGRDPNLPKWSRTSPYPAHRKNHLSAGTVSEVMPHGASHGHDW